MPHKASPAATQLRMDKITGKNYLFYPPEPMMHLTTVQPGQLSKSYDFQIVNVV